MSSDKETAQQNVYQHGMELAFHANEAFDRQKTATTTSEAHGAQADYITYRNAVGALIGPEVFPIMGGVTSEQNATRPEPGEKIQKITDALVQKFDLEPSEVSVINVVRKDGTTQQVVMHTGVRGIYRGGFDQIMSPEEEKAFTIEVDGEKIDTRKGMTREAYIAFLNDAMARGVNPLPDTAKLVEQGPEWTIWEQTRTWLTGGDQFNTICIAEYEDTKPTGIALDFSKDDQSGLIRFRPAVVVAES